jgi:hypothetical protein
MLPLVMMSAPTPLAVKAVVPLDVNGPTLRSPVFVVMEAVVTASTLRDHRTIDLIDVGSDCTTSIADSISGIQ